jgi:membrane-associated phospholipid phosphatase
MAVRFRILILALSFSLGVPTLAVSQSDPLPDSPSQARQAAAQPDAPEKRQVTWHRFPKDLLEDQKAIWWKFPNQLAHGQHLLPTLAIVGGTAGLIVADPHVMPYFRTHDKNFDGVNDTLSTAGTTTAVVLLPVSLLVAGYARHDDYQKDTALLAGEAYADSALVDLAIKAISRRKRPVDVPPNGDFGDTFFAGGKSPFKGSAFPSGHAAGAFAVATVVATRYRSHRWVPWVVYGMATAVSLSRMTTNSHFPSDIFLGAALGYSISRYQVLRPRGR